MQLLLNSPYYKYLLQNLRKNVLSVHCQKPVSHNNIATFSFDNYNKNEDKFGSTSFMKCHNFPFLSLEED